MAILEDEDGADEDGLDDEPVISDGIGDESVDEAEDDMTSFGGSSTQATSVMEASSAGTMSSTISFTASTSDAFLAEIFAQEYKARNRVREIKKMRQ